MKHLSLFSGIGGFDLAARWMGWQNVAQVEKDKFCLKLLKQNFPKSKQYGDIKEFNGKEYTGAIDIISGGFPCQPHSVAGKRKGQNDERFLWPEMLRVIKEVSPRWVVGENVFGSLSDGVADRVKTSLENIGYKTTIFVIPACSAGAQHKRDRVWFFAHTNGGRWENGIHGKKQRGETKESGDSFKKSNGGTFRDITSGGDRTGNGVPGRVDRIKGLGNAVCPPLVYEIFKIIERADNELFKYCEGCTACPSPCNSENNYHLPF